MFSVSHYTVTLYLLLRFYQLINIRIIVVIFCCNQSKKSCLFGCDGVFSHFFFCFHFVILVSTESLLFSCSKQHLTISTINIWEILKCCSQAWCYQNCRQAYCFALLLGSNPIFQRASISLIHHFVCMVQVLISQKRSGKTPSHVNLHCID